MTKGAPANVLDFGAIGNGVADDTAAIQLAIDSSESIYLPPGVYLISDQLNILGTVDPVNGQYRGKNIFGAGIKATTIKAKSGYSANFMFHIGNSNWNTEIKWSVQNQLSNFTIDHEYLGNFVTSAAIFVTGAFDTKISDIKVGVPDIPVTKWDLFVSSGSYLTSVDFLQCKTIQASTPTYGQIVGLTLNTCSGVFVNLVGCNSAAFNNFVMQGSPAVGYQATRIQIDNCNNVSFLNGDLEGEGTMFAVSNSTNLWVANNNVAMQGSYTTSGGVNTACVFYSILNNDGILSQNNKFMNWTSGPLGPSAGVYYSNGGGNSRLKIFDFKGNYFTGASYTRNTTQSIPSSTVTIVNFADQKFDEGSNVTTGSSWKFTAPFRGAYSVDSNVLLENFNISTDGAYIAIFVDGTEQYRSFANSSSPSNATTLSVSGVVLADAGKFINVRIWSNSAASNIAAAATANFVNIQFQNVY